MPLTANRDLDRFIDQELRALKVKAATRVYKGGFVGFDRATGYIRGLSAGDLFAGIAYEESDNSTGANGDRSCRLYTQGDFQAVLAGAVQTDVGKPVFASADDTLTFAGGGPASYVGRCVDVPVAGKVIVRVEPLWLSQDIRTASVPLQSLTTALTTNAVLITQRPILVLSAHVVFNTKPDVGNLDVGTGNTNPTEIVTAFSLPSLTNHVPTTLTLVNPSVVATTRIWARVGQATTTAGVGGMLTLRYIELP